MAPPSIYVFHYYDVQLSTNLHSPPAFATLPLCIIRTSKSLNSQANNIYQYHIYQMYCYLYNRYLIHTYTSNLKVMPFCNLYGS